MIDPATTALLAAAFVAGGLDAIVGGGGLIQLPALVTALPGAAPATLLGTSKLAGLAGTSSAAARYLRAVRLPWRSLAPLLMVALVTSLAGSLTVSHVSAGTFRPLVPVALSAVLIYTLVNKDFGRRHAPRMLDRRDRLIAGGTVGLIGFYDGFFGPGTGSFLMLFFIRVYGFDFLIAAAAARVLNIATNLAALTWFGAHGHVLWPLGLMMGVLNVAGAQLGTRLALGKGVGFVRRLFIAIVTALIAKTGWDALRLLASG